MRESWFVVLQINDILSLYIETVGTSNMTYDNFLMRGGLKFTLDPGMKSILLWLVKFSKICRELGLKRLGIKSG